jgi:hypothetical protein
MRIRAYQRRRYLNPDSRSACRLALVPLEIELARDADLFRSRRPSYWGTVSLQDRQARDEPVSAGLEICGQMGGHLRAAQPGRKGLSPRRERHSCGPRSPERGLTLLKAVVRAEEQRRLAVVDDDVDQILPRLRDRRLEVEARPRSRHRLPNLRSSGPKSHFCIVAAAGLCRRPPLLRAID